MTATSTSSLHGRAHGPAHGRSDTSVVSYLAYLGIVLAVGSDIMLIFGALGLVLLLWAGDSRELVRT